MQVVSEFVGTFSLIFIGSGAAAVIGEGIGLPGITAIALAHRLTVTAFAFAYVRCREAILTPPSRSRYSPPAPCCRGGRRLHRQPVRWRCPRSALVAGRARRCRDRPR